MTDTPTPLPGFAQSDEEAQEKYEEYCSKDPFPSIFPALLNSADIMDYVAATGMIYPFVANRETLKSASYSIDILGDCLYWDENGQKKEFTLGRNDELSLAPNSIVFVTLEPMFRIPDYLALRFNLQISHVYRGLLLGTGPLVDPGFQGKLSLPLHNLTSNIYKLKGGEPLIWMEFTKLSPNKTWEMKLKDDGETSELERLGKFIHFPARKINKDLSYYIFKAVGLDEKVRSSIPVSIEEAKRKSIEAVENASKAKDAIEESGKNIEKTQQEIKDTIIDFNNKFEQLKSSLAKDIETIKAQTKGEISTVTRYSAIASAVVGLLFIGGLLYPSYTLVKTTSDNLKNAEIDVKMLREKEFKDLTDKVDTLQKQVAELEKKLSSFNSKVPPVTPKKP
jgi:deoxycytidine triphosphate deaminase